MDHSIEVYYFERKQYSRRSELFFPPIAAVEMFQKTLNKFNENKEQIIAVLRDEKKNILKSERLNF